MPPRSHIRPSLPQSLLEEIKGEDNSAHKHKRKGGQQLPRRDARKQAREGRKLRKAKYFSAAQTQKYQQNAKRPAEPDHAESPQRKKARLEPVQQPVPRPPAPKKRETKDSTSDKPGRNVPKHKTALEKLAERSEAPKARRQRTERPLNAILRTPQEQEEDAYIAYTERKLGYVKGGKRTGIYGKGEEEDGLDDLLNDLDALETSVATSPYGGLGESESDVDQDGETEVSHDDSVSDEDEDEDMDEEVELNAGKDGDDEWHGFTNHAEEAASKSEQLSDSLTVTEGSNLEPAVPGGSKYVPPHLRKQAEADHSQSSEAQMRLAKQLKGLLNRMSEQNITSIVDGVEEVYRNNRRHDVTEILTKLIIDGISSHSMLLDQYVVLHAAFVSALHRLVGIEFAAFFVQHVVSSYDVYFAALKHSDTPDAPSQPTGNAPAGDELIGKECSNLVVLLSELYNFQVISCVLIYDVIRALLDGDLTEFKVELLLKVARNSGQQLRQDDPTALKSIIQIVHSKLPEDTNTLSSRKRFMVETLSNLKNNKIKKAAGQMAGGEAVERMKKFLSGLSKKRHVMSHEPLRVSLADLRSAETKGKWWLVGAAWGGDLLVEHRQGAQDQDIISPSGGPSENVLLKLAKKQGMNTDIRRGIFVVLMSSDDFVDACERLAQLKLTEVQQREIVRVILHCCGNEKQYNPYYALVGQQLCRLSHSHRITLQFCLWDFLRDMGETTVGGAEILKDLNEDAHAGFDVKAISGTRMRNVACAFGWWIAKDCCTLAILKPVDFTVLKVPTQAFLKELFTHALANTQLATPLLGSDLPSTRNKGVVEDMISKGAKMPTLALGMVYFLRETFRGEDGFLDWAKEVALDTLRTSTNVIPAI